MYQEVYRTKGLSTCRNGHTFMSEKFGNKCPRCGSVLEIPDSLEYEHLSLLDTDFPCGVIVSVGEINRGQSYPIHVGVNSIGNDADMDICIENDSNIKPINHTYILFDEVEQKTYLAMYGSATGLSYLNDVLVIDSKEISSGDTIKIGNSIFQFLQLSSAELNWANNFGNTKLISED